MNNELVVDVAASEITIALLEDKQLVELHKEQSNANFSVGDIYLGRVKKLMPGLNAAFIDVGYQKDAFLHYLDLGVQFLSMVKYVGALLKKERTPDISKFKMEKNLSKDGKISDVLTVGQPVLVQIAKEPISTKGPRLTAEISIANRNMVLLPFADKVSISQKIASNEERKRLKRLMDSIVPRNYGVIMRTACENRKVATLHNELRAAIHQWEACCEKIRTSPPPSLIATEMNRTTAMLRDLLNVSFNNIYINNEALYNEVKEYIGSIAPEKEKIVALYEGRKPIFEHFGLTKQVKSGFGRVVSLKGGAYLVIDHTEALHVVDVNSGIRSNKGSDSQENNALDVNLNAAQEIARQLRLRDMGGIIVIDFIDMYQPENRKTLYERMVKFMENDRAKHNILPLSKFGLMQLTRQRVRPEMKIQTQEACPTCNGTGKVGPTILFDEQLESRVAYLTSEEKERNLALRVHPFVAAYLCAGIFSSKRRLWQRKYHCRLKVIPSQECGYLEFFFYNKKGEDLC
ncbi:MAG: Rne/Rng family ribonuclease [Prevotellaceae bacterium]|jgi:ribonuclease G|nr:Rne/Rng family ribonuclease [Prevotellaceae bacterium]